VKERQKKHEQDPSRLLRLFLRICAAVSAAHLRGVVHRDLKPSNILIDDRGEPHILDFGLARTALDTIAQNGNAPISITGEFLGSLPWSSPEQAEGDPDKIDIRTDVYSLGVILYQMITGGHFPYQVVGNIRDVLNNILTAEPTPPSKLMLASKDRRTVSPRLPLVNEAIEKIVLKALAKKREKRYQSAGELGREIANYLSGLPTRPREGSGEKPSVSANVEPRLVKPLLVVAASVAFVIVSAALTVWFPRRPSKPANVIASTKTASLISPRISVVSSETKTPNSVTLIKPKPTKVTPAPVAEIKPDTAPAVPVVPPPDAKVFRHHHFKVFAEAVGWYDAARECAAMGGHLAKVDDSDQLAFLQKLKGTDTISWVGGSADLHGNWTWSDGAAIALDRISTDPQHPEFRWLFLSSNGKLLTRPQNGRIDSAQFPVVEGFVCERDQ
jgi:serine/threonine protein kinase